MAKTERRNTTLITRFSALGDVAMTLPLIYNVASSHPERHFLLLTRPLPARIFLDAPANLTVVGVDLDAHGAPRDVAALVRRVTHDYHIDTYADLHDVLRTKLMRLLLMMRGVRCAHIDKQRRQRKALTRANAKLLTPLTPVHVLYADVFTRLGLERTKSFISLFGPDGAPPSLMTPAIGGMVKEEGQTWIAIAPFARHKGKIYPVSLMKEVVSHYVSQPGISIFLLGAGAEETAVLEEMASLGDNIYNVAARRAGIEAEMALLSHCDALLSMDSANMHLASLVGCPVVSVWGATHPYTGFYERRQSMDNAVQLALPCRPCSIYGNRPCRRGDYLCLFGLRPELITSRLDRVCALTDER